MFKRLPPAKRTCALGHVHDSRDERDYCGVLQARQKLGEIRDLRVQVRIPLGTAALGPVLMRSDGCPNGRACFYTLDFMYVDRATSETIRIEFKPGLDDPTSKLRRSVVEWIHGIRIRVIDKKGRERYVKKAQARKTK